MLWIFIFLMLPFRGSSFKPLKKLKGASKWLWLLHKLKCKSKDKRRNKMLVQEIVLYYKHFHNLKWITLWFIFSLMPTMARGCANSIRWAMIKPLLFIVVMFNLSKYLWFEWTSNMVSIIFSLLMFILINKPKLGLQPNLLPF